MFAPEERAKFTYPRIIEAQKQALEAWLNTGLTNEINAARVLLATFYWMAGDLRLGEQIIKEALQAYRHPQSPTDYDRHITALAPAAGIARDTGDYQSAIGYYREIINIKGKRPGADPSLLISASNALASLYSDLGRYTDARKIIAESKQVLGAYQGSKPMASSWANVLLQELSMWLLKGEINRGIFTLAEANHRLGATSAQTTESDRSTIKAMASVIQSFACAKQLKSSHILSNQFSSTASDPNSVKDTSPITIQQTAQAQEQGYGLSELIEKAKAEGNWRLEADHLSTEAIQAQGFGDYQQAVILNQRALALIRKRHAAPKEAELMAELAEIATDQGEPQKGLQWLQQSLSLQESLGHGPAQVKTLEKIAFLYKSLGAESLAFSYADRARLLAGSLGMSEGEVSSLSMIALIRKQQQRLPDAEQALRQAIPVAERSGNCVQQTMLHNQMANLLADSGNLRDAAMHAAKADALASSLFNEDFQTLGQAQARRTKARILLKQGNHQAASKEAEDALRIAKRSNNKKIQSHLLATLAESHVALGNLPRAITLYRQQLDLLTTMNLAPDRAQSLYAIAQLQRRQGDRAVALATINQAIAIVETIRKQVVDPELRTSFFASKQDFYSFKIDLLLEWEQLQPGAGHAAEAFHTSERSRARTLLELLDDARADIRQGIAPDLLEQQKALQYKRTALDKRWQQAFSEKGDPSLLPQLQQERQQLLQRTRELRQTIRARSPRYAALTDPEPLHLAQVQQQLLEPDTVLLQYALGKERSHLFVVGHDELQVIPLPAAATIRSLVEALRTPLTLNQERSQIQRRAAALSQHVLAPASAAIGRHRKVMVVADGPLHLVPFTALPLNPASSNSPTLGDGHPLLYLPSSSTLALIRQQSGRVASRRAASIAILADPVFSAKDPRLLVAPADVSSRPSQPTPSSGPSTDLKELSFQRASVSLENCDNQLSHCRLGFTRTEARSIAALLPPNRVSLAVDFAADLQRATSADLGRYSLVHFATHGLFNVKQPALSGLLLSRVDRSGTAKDGFLQLGDIFNLKLNADLVVLSACETGLGDQVQGEGLVGITRGFLYAGTPRVVVSLWQVSDEATAAFMTSFYEAMLQRKLPASEALLAAQKELRAHPQWTSPYYWAAFALQGDW